MKVNRINEIKQLYPKLLRKKNIGKSEILQLGGKLKDLKPFIEDNVFTNLTNRTISASNKKGGRPKNLEECNISNEIYQELLGIFEKSLEK